MSSRTRTTVVPVVIGLLAFLSVPSAPGDVLTRSYDNARSGHASNETVLTPASVANGQLRYLTSLDVDGDVFAQPLYVQDLQMGALGERDVVFVATNHNTVFAFDAATATPLWHTSLGPSVRRDWGCDDSTPHEFGITSTPVIDRGTGRLYTVAATQDAAGYHQTLYMLDIVTGAKLQWQEIEGIHTIEDSRGRTHFWKFHAEMQLNRPGLLLSGTNVIIAFGAHCDADMYTGWVFAYKSTDIRTQTGVFVTTPTKRGNGGGIWMAGQGPAVDSQGNIYVMTGNSTPTMWWNDPGFLRTYWKVIVEPELMEGRNFGDAFVKLGPPPGTGSTAWKVVDWFAPNERDSKEMFRVDNDLGSGGAIVIPRSSGAPWVIGGGKAGKLYVLDSAKMGHYVPTEDRVVQAFQATPVCSNTRTHIHGSPVWWKDNTGVHRIYLWGESSPVQAFRLHDDGRRFPVEENPLVTSQVKSPFNTMPGGVLTISSNGGKPESGIVWGTSPVGKQTGGGYTRLAALRAFDARTLRELYVGPTYRLSKFSPPTVADGRVYVATFDHRVDVYGLGNPPATSSVYAFGGMYQVEDWVEPDQTGDVCKPANALDHADDALDHEHEDEGGINSAEEWPNSMPNPLSRGFHCPSAPFYIEDGRGNRVARWFSSRVVGRGQGGIHRERGVTQYACIGRIDPGYTWRSEWGGQFQKGEAGCNSKNTIGNPFLPPTTTDCPGGKIARLYGSALSPQEQSSCLVTQSFCSSDPGLGFQFGGMFQRSCNPEFKIGNPVLRDGRDACPDGMFEVQTGWIQVPDTTCGATQFACFGAGDRVLFGGMYQIEDDHAGCAGQSSPNSQKNPITGTFGCPGAPFKITNSSGTVDRWYTARIVGRIKGAAGNQCGVTQYACLGYVDPGFDTAWNWKGNYQLDPCGGTNTVNNPLLSPPQPKCPDGSESLVHGRILRAEPPPCAAEQRLCRPASPGTPLGGFFQRSDESPGLCDQPRNVGNPVRYDKAADCPAGMRKAPYGRVKVPEGNQCGATQYVCWP